MVSTNKKIALLHRYPSDQIKETNAAFPYLAFDYNPSIDLRPSAVNYYPKNRMDVLTFKKFDRLSRFRKFWKSLAWIFYAPFIIFGKNYDVIYCDDSYPFYPALVKLVSPKSKVVMRIGDLHLMYNYSGWIYDFLHFFEKISWRMADQIIVISEAMRDYMHQQGFCCSVVLDPVDPDDFKYPSNTGDGSVMFHGTLTKNKNVDILLEAARRLPSIDFTIVGDGPDLKRLKKIAPFNVYFTGWVPFKDISRKISECSIGVALRSNNPGNEYVVTSPFLQYGIMGKPCLVTRRKVFGEYPYQFGDVDELVAKIKYILKEPNPHATKHIRDSVIKNHDAKKIAEDIWCLLQA